MEEEGKNRFAKKLTLLYFTFRYKSFMVYEM